MAIKKATDPNSAVHRMRRKEQQAKHQIRQYSWLLGKTDDELEALVEAEFTTAAKQKAFIKGILKLLKRLVRLADTDSNFPDMRS